eukprot:3596474-Prymnesium_polylepis.1
MVAGSILHTCHSFRIPSFHFRGHGARLAGLRLGSGHVRCTTHVSTCATTRSAQPCGCARTIVGCRL